MTRGRALFALTSILLVVIIASGTFSSALAREQGEEDSLYKSLSIFTEVLNLIRRTYVDETSVEHLFSGALGGATDALDSMSTYVPSESVESYERAREIGIAHSGISVVKERGFVYVLAVAPGSPGDAIGLARGDALNLIDGRRTRRMPLWEIQTLLAGEAGTQLQLEVVRRGQNRDETLTLALYEPKAASIELSEEIPVLAVSELREQTATEVESLLSGLVGEGSEALVLDLRGVAGGENASAYAVAELFVEGKLGGLKRREELLETFSGERAPVWNGSLVVLIDRSSQGPAEILATVLEQAAGAELVGERTFGHAGRQSSFELSTGGQLFLTDAFYTGPDELPIQSGLEPGTLVSEASRNLSEAGVPLRELILLRGLDRLREVHTLKRAA